MCKNMRKKLIAAVGILGIISMIIFCNFFVKIPMIETINYYLHKDEENFNNKYKSNKFLAPKRNIKKSVEGEKICYLTFDDGPSENTVKILNILKQYDAKATFFVIGNCIDEETREILERIIEEGHAIGLHANNHVYERVFLYEKPIVLLHDSCIADKTVEALPGLLKEIKEKGYSFSTLECREEYTF